MTGPPIRSITKFPGSSRSQSLKSWRSKTNWASSSRRSQLLGRSSPPRKTSRLPSGSEFELGKVQGGDGSHRVHRAVGVVAGIDLNVEMMCAAGWAKDSVGRITPNRADQVETIRIVETPTLVEIHHASELRVVRVRVLYAGVDPRSEEAQQVAEAFSAVGGRIRHAFAHHESAALLQRGAKLFPNVSAHHARVGGVVGGGGVAHDGSCGRRAACEAYSDHAPLHRWDWTLRLHLALAHVGKESGDAFHL